jgi:hypothetical protein
MRPWAPVRPCRALSCASRSRGRRAGSTRGSTRRPRSRRRARSGPEIDVAGVPMLDRPRQRALAHPIRRGAPGAAPDSLAGADRGERPELAAPVAEAFTRGPREPVVRAQLRSQARVCRRSSPAAARSSATCSGASVPSCTRRSRPTPGKAPALELRATPMRSRRREAADAVGTPAASWTSALSAEAGPGPPALPRPGLRPTRRARSPCHDERFGESA